MQVKWLRRALRNLEEEAAHLAHDKPQAAAALISAVDESTCFLARHPGKGRPGRVPGTRERVLPHFSYIIPYRVKGQRVGFSGCFTLRENGRRDSTPPSRRLGRPLPDTCCACATKQHFCRRLTEKTTTLLAGPARVWIIDCVPQAHLCAGQFCRVRTALFQSKEI